MSSDVPAKLCTTQGMEMSQNHIMTRISTPLCIEYSSLIRHSTDNHMMLENVSVLHDYMYHPRSEGNEG